MSLENSPNPAQPENSGLHTLIVGDGWAALAAAGFLASSGERVTWVTGTGSRLAFPLPAIEGFAEAWRKLALVLGIDALSAGEAFDVERGSFLRAYRNKAFREPEWITEAGESRTQDEEELKSLWPADQLWARQWCERLPLGFEDLERQCRAALLKMTEKSASEKSVSGKTPNGTPVSAPLLTRIEGVPVTKISGGRSGGVLPSVTLADGRELGAHRVIFADRWESRGTEGLRSVLGEEFQGEAFSLLKGRDPVGVLQATFEHSVAIGVGVREGFCAALSRESGEKFERNVWGSFSGDGRRSTWTVCLTAEESEDNHEITKKLRRSRNLLEKMFSQEPWCTLGSFESSITAEHVRFEELFAYTGGTAPVSASEIKGLSGVTFLTDGYGPGSAIQQALSLLLGEPIGANAPTQAGSASGAGGERPLS